MLHDDRLVDRRTEHCAFFEQVAAVLLAAGADVNTRNKDGQTPLHKACAPRAARLR